MTLILQVDPSTLSTAQQKGERVVGGFVRHYIKPQVKRSQERMENAILDEWEKSGRPVEVVRDDKRRKFVRKCKSPIAPKEPLFLTLTFVFPFKSGTPKYLRERPFPIPMVDRPDIDNMVKGLQDAMTAVNLIPDDAQIVSLSVLKIRMERPHITLGLWRYDEVVKIQEQAERSKDPNAEEVGEDELG